MHGEKTAFADLTATTKSLAEEQGSIVNSVSSVREIFLKTLSEFIEANP
jgi:hypothetical protein